MVKNPKYVLIQDTKTVFSRIGDKDKIKFNTSFANVVDDYLIELVSSFSLAFNGKVDIQVYSELEVEKALELCVSNELRVDSNAVCICLDRFLLNTLENANSYKQRFFRFHICRSFDDKKIPRQGSMPFLKQLENLKQLISQLNNKHLIVVDDGIFSGGTVKEFLELLFTKSIRASVKKVIAFVCSQKNLKNFTLVPLKVIKPIKNLYDWVNIRDLSPLGGKILSTSKKNRIYNSIPYLYPWSDGSNASLNMSSQFFIVSQKMIQAFKKLVMAYENTTGNKPLTFRKLVKNGFPLPTNFERNIPISLNDSVREYLNRCIKLIQIEKDRQIIIFDMDGILYLLDGENNGYRGSTLEKIILQKAGRFIKAREGCNDTQANAILKNGLKDPIGLSAYLARKYKISRLEYFNSVWNIYPAKIIKNNNQVTKIISFLKQKSQLKTILLTSAPRIWTYKVLEYLGIDKSFESIYTGEQYGQKEEIFKLLAGRYKPGNIISIGDQYQTDIEPAQKMGMRTLQVKTPKDLEQLLNILQ